MSRSSADAAQIPLGSLNRERLDAVPFTHVEFAIARSRQRAGLAEGRTAFLASKWK